MDTKVKLSTEQARVARMLSEGQTPRTIALALGVSTQRVYQTMEHIRTKHEKAASA
jgi:DNA-binding CsgD family transcriptional regulator